MVTILDVLEAILIKLEDIKAEAKRYTENLEIGEDLIKPCFVVTNENYLEKECLGKYKEHKATFDIAYYGVENINKDYIEMKALLYKNIKTLFIEDNDIIENIHSYEWDIETKIVEDVLHFVITYTWMSNEIEVESVMGALIQN